MAVLDPAEVGVPHFSRSLREVGLCGDSRPRLSTASSRDARALARRIWVAQRFQPCEKQARSFNLSFRPERTLSEVEGKRSGGTCFPRPRDHCERTTLKRRARRSDSRPALAAEAGWPLDTQGHLFASYSLNGARKQVSNYKKTNEYKRDCALHARKGVS